MITIKAIADLSEPYEEAVAEGVRQFIRESYGITVVVEIASLPLDPTPYLFGWGTRVTRKTGTFSPRAMFEQREERYLV